MFKPLSKEETNTLILLAQRKNIKNKDWAGATFNDELQCLICDQIILFSIIDETVEDLNRSASIITEHGRDHLKDLKVFI